jgi:HlyD family secretion protein
MSGKMAGETEQTANGGLKPTRRPRRPWPLFAAVAAIAVAFATYWFLRPGPDAPEGFARANGRIEAERLDIAAKYPGRLKEVLVKEGDAVTAGQLLARMDTAEQEAQLHEAEASVRQSERLLDQAIALLAQRRSELALSGQQLDRSEKLVKKGYSTQEMVDSRRSVRAAAEAAEASAQAQISVARAAIDAGVARVERIKTFLDDAALRAPRAGRVQYRLALPGEVLPAGGKILTLLDLTDVYMTVFLPTRDAGRLALGSEARLIFDAAPQYVVPATITFVAADAQFTPKYVETRSEREKLMFRVKVQIPKELLEKYADVVKTGVPGVAYVKLTHAAVWPPRLAVRLPQ